MVVAALPRMPYGPGIHVRPLASSSSSATGSYASVVRADNPLVYWALDEGINALTVADSSPHAVVGAVVGDGLARAVPGIVAGVSSFAFGLGAKAAALAAWPGGTYLASGYGAVGDGTTDDTTHLQNAIDAAYAAGGGTVALADGTFRVATTVSLKNGVRLTSLSGSAVACVVKGAATYADYVLKAEASNNGSHDVRVDNVTVDADRFNAGANPLGDAARLGTLALTGVARATVDSCRLLNSKRSAVRVLGTGTAFSNTDLLVQRCTISLSGDDGVEILDCARARVLANTITDCSNCAVHAAPTDATMAVKALEVGGNLVSCAAPVAGLNTAHAGVLVRGSGAGKVSGADVHHNQATAVSTGAQIVENVYGGVLRSNHVAAATVSGVQVGLAGVNTNGVVVRDNTVYGTTGGTDIVLSQASYAVVFDNAGAVSTVSGGTGNLIDTMLPARTPTGDGTGGARLASVLAAGLGYAADAPVSLAAWPHATVYDVTAAPYNAKGDGTTDDTTAIQNALNACASAGGGTVYLPSGVYAVPSAVLQVGSNTQLLGDGWSKTTVKRTTATTNNLWQNTNFTAPGNQNLRVVGITFDANRRQLGSTGGNGGRLTDVQTVEIDGCFFLDALDENLNLVDNGTTPVNTDVLVQRTAFAWAGDSNIDCIDCQRFTVCFGRFVGANESQVNIEPHSAVAAKVTSAKVYRNVASAAVLEAGGPGGSHYGVNLSGFAFGTVQGVITGPEVRHNAFYAHANGLAAGGGNVTGALVHDNDSRSNSGYGANVGISGTTTAGLSLTNNTFAANTTHDVQLVGATGCTVTGNNTTDVFQTGGSSGNTVSAGAGATGWPGDASVAGITSTGAFSLEAPIVVPAASVGRQTIAGKEAYNRATGANDGFALSLDSSLRPVFSRSASTTTHTAVGSALTPGATAFLVGTYDGTTMRLYVNGAQVASTASTLSLAATTAPFRVGARACTDGVLVDPFLGTTAHVAAYGAALSAARVAAHYAATGSVGSSGGGTGGGYGAGTYGNWTYGA